MMRNIYLEGELGEKFGNHWELDCASYKEALDGIDCNTSGLREYLLDCQERGIGFTFFVEDKPLQFEEQLIMKLQPGDIVITPMVSGSKSGGAKILAAIAIAVITFKVAGPGSWAAKLNAKVAGMSAKTAAAIGYGIATNLALAGIQQIMAPDPATDQGQDEGYLFNGTEQNIIEGDPVPVLYGELRVPGRPMSFEVLNDEFLAIDSGASALDLDLGYV